MTISHDQAAAKRARADILRLQKQDADEARKIAQSTQRANQAANAALKASSASIITSKLREQERYLKEVERAQAKRAELADKIAKKTKDLYSVEERLSKKVNDQQAKDARAADKLRKAQEDRLRQLENKARVTIESESLSREKSGEPAPRHDVFISHASEDKDGFVRELAEKCNQAGIDAWYDETAIQWGQSLRQAIDHGLSNAFFGVVILSENFFKKQWTNYEFDGLIQKEISGHGAVLPIWHKVSKDEVESFSAPLANRLALNTAVVTIDEIVEELRLRVDELRPSGNVYD